MQKQLSLMTHMYISKQNIDSKTDNLPTTFTPEMLSLPEIKSKMSRIFTTKNSKLRRDIVKPAAYTTTQILLSGFHLYQSLSLTGTKFGTQCVLFRRQISLDCRVLSILRGKKQK